MIRGAGVAAAPFAALIAALLLYAARGTPTPESFGMAEALVALLLVAAAGPVGVMAALAPGQAMPWMRAAQGLLLYGLSVPVIVGLVRGNDPALMLRDVIPFIFLLMPLLLYPLVRGSTARLVVLTMAAATVGLAFSWRVLVPAFMESHGMGAVAARMAPSDPGYMANAPTVIFAAILLAGVAGLRLLAGMRTRNVMAAGLLLALAALPFVTMALIMQRASIWLWLGAMALLMLRAFLWRPYRALPVMALALLLAVLVGPWVAGLMADLAEKTAAVGLNRRWQEAQAVLDAVGGDIFTVLFGRGWGATIASPAVGEVTVNFTHNLFTTYWLKAGLFGLVLVAAYIAALARLLWPLWRAAPVVALALGVPLAIDITLYASFKSLDFGVILLLLALWGGRAVSLHPRPVYSMS